jgi:hypothetical protein
MVWLGKDKNKEYSGSDLVGVLHVCCFKKKLQSVSVIGAEYIGCFT